MIGKTLWITLIECTVGNVSKIIFKKNLLHLRLGSLGNVPSDFNNT